MQPALEQMQRLHPEPNYDVGTMQWQLGVIRFNRGDPEENAEELIRQGMQTTVQIMGPHHPLSCTPKHYLATLLAAKGRLDEAISLYVEITRYGDGDQIVGYAVELVELVKEDIKWSGQAEEVLRGALDKHEPILGPDHPTIAGIQHRLGALLMAEGRFPEAESFLTASEAAFLTDTDGRATELCEIQRTLAELYQQWATETQNPEFVDRYRRLLDLLD